MSGQRERMLSAAHVHAMLRGLPESTLMAQTGGNPLLVIAPHPDDESLGCGGLIAQAVSRGQSVSVLILTDGSRSHPKSREYPPARLRRLREVETAEAMRALGLEATHLCFMGLPDSRAPHCGSAFERAAEAIATHAASLDARVIFTTWRHDPHCDHGAASKLAGRAASLLGASLYEYPIWGWTLPPRRLLRVLPIKGFRLDTRAQQVLKERAIACHRSQLGKVITDDPAGFVMSLDFIGLFNGGWETFIEVGVPSVG